MCLYVIAPPCTTLLFHLITSIKRFYDRSFFFFQINSKIKKKYLLFIKSIEFSCDKTTTRKKKWHEYKSLYLGPEFLIDWRYS